MEIIKKNYKKVFGEEPSPELVKRLSSIKYKLQIDENDSIWVLFMGAGYLREMYVKIPEQIDSHVKNLKLLFHIFIGFLLIFIIIFISQTMEQKNLINNLYSQINENKILTEQLAKLNTRLNVIEKNYYNNNNNNYGKNNSLSNPTINTNSNQYNNIVPSPNNYQNNNNYGQNNNLSNPTINIDPNKYNNIFPNPNSNFNNR